MFLAADGTMLGPFRREIETFFPEPFYVEQDPRQWYNLIGEALAEAFQTGLVDKSHIKALLPSSATHTVVLLDSHFKPVRRSIMWNDQRSAALASQFSEPERVFHLTNHLPSPMWSLFQNLWVKVHEPGVWSKVRYMLSPKDYVRFLLTGEYGTDYTDAEGTQLYDVHRKEWSGWLCGHLDFPVTNMPLLRRSTDLAGQVTPRAAEELGLLAGTPVYIGTTDTALEVMASGALDLEDTTIKLATSGRICVITDRVYPHELLVNYSHVIDGFYYVGTGTRSCTASLRWFRDQFAYKENEEAKASGKSVYAVLDNAAMDISPGCEGLFFHPYLLGEFTPYANDKLRASFVGVTMKHTRAHFVRAVLEGVAYSLRDGMNTLQDIGLGRKNLDQPLTLIGGGSISRLWGKILSEVLNRKLEVLKNSDSSLGGAMLAGVACGMFTDAHEAFRICNEITDVITPDPDNAASYDQLFHYYKDIVAVLLPVYERLGAN